MNAYLYSFYLETYTMPRRGRAASPPPAAAPVPRAAAPPPPAAAPAPPPPAATAPVPVAAAPTAVAAPAPQGPGLMAQVKLLFDNDS